MAASGSEVQQPLKKMLVLPGMIEHVMDNCPSSRTPRATKEDNMIPAIMKPKRAHESRAPRQHKTNNPSVQRCLGVLGSPSLGKINGTSCFWQLSCKTLLYEIIRLYTLGSPPFLPHSMLRGSRNRPIYLSQFTHPRNLLRATRSIECGARGLQ